MDRKISIIWLVCLLGLAAWANATPTTYGSVGIGTGINTPSPITPPCGNANIYLNYDDSAENAYCWQYGGTVPPCYGAFAECYRQTGTVCGIELALTSLGNPCRTYDAYVWDDRGGSPGNVLSMTTGKNPCPVSTWPNVYTIDMEITPVSVAGSFWIGYWADFSAQPCGYFIAADLDGRGGCPYTNIAPGIGFPTGWQNVSVVWGPTKALGIGAWLTDLSPGACCYNNGGCSITLQDDCPGQWRGADTTCDPSPCDTPVRDNSWGRMKATYR